MNKSTNQNDSGLLIFGIVFLYIFGAFIGITYARDEGPFPSLPYHYSVLGIAIGAFLLACCYFAHRVSELQRNNTSQESAFSFLGQMSMIFLLGYGIEAVLHGFFSLPHLFFLFVDVKVVLFLAVYYGACVLFVWPYYHVVPEKIVIVDTIVHFPYQEIFLSSLKNYHIYGIDRVIRIPRTTIHDVEFKSGDCLPITFETSVEINIDTMRAIRPNGNGITKALLAKKSAIWIGNVLRERAKDKTLTEFLIMQHPLLSENFAGWPIVWKPKPSALWPIEIVL
ncbi:MAG: hypothetical protein HYZ69_03040 [Candidatus Colwellbacteria bacterium]|nr:hypothetical protein [Candidatus Colwellbacteria bacterium]